MPQRGNDSVVLGALRREASRLASRVTMALDATGYQMVDLARSTTAEMRPPVRKGEGPRAAHPGGWADVTGETAGSIRHTAEAASASRFRLTLEAGGAARYLERRGYWVLSGLFEGHVQAALRNHLDDAFRS